MADVFQKLKSTVNRGITTISVKTSSSLEKTQIKTQIDTLTKSIESAHSYVGEAAYRIWESGSTDFSSLNEQFVRIKEMRVKIDELSAQIAAIDERDKQILGGQSADAQNISGSSSVIICNSCGAKYDSPVKFCRKCGNKLSD